MIVTTRDCEIVKQLVAAFCDHDPERIDISVEECLDLFARMVLASWDRGPVSESNTGAGHPAEERTTPQSPAATAPLTRGAEGPAERERERETPARGGSDPSADDSPGRGLTGRSCVQKRAILDRLLQYRKAHGLGSYRRLVEVANGAITDDEIRRMAEAEKLPLAKWKILSAALDHIEHEED